MKKQKKTAIILLAVMILMTVLIAQGAHYRNAQHNKQMALIASNENLVNELKTQLNLPYTKPIIATVYDPVDFKNNSELAGLQKGDKIILYISSNEAILYRPSEKKILNILPAKAVLRTRS